MFGKKIGETGNQWKNGDIWDFSSVDIGQNTKKSPVYLKWLNATQIPMNDHQLMLEWETRRK